MAPRWSPSFRSLPCPSPLKSSQAALIPILLCRRLTTPSQHLTRWLALLTLSSSLFLALPPVVSILINATTISLAGNLEISFLFLPVYIYLPRTDNPDRSYNVAVDTCPQVLIWSGSPELLAASRNSRPVRAPSPVQATLAKATCHL